MVRPQKELAVKELAERLESAKALILSDYRGLNVSEITALRNRMRDASIEYRVVKNTLARFAASKVNLSMLVPYLAGPTAIAFGHEDPIAPARIMVGFAKENPNFTIKVGLLEGKIVGLEKVKELARLPGKDALYSMVIGRMRLPLVSLINVFYANLRKLFYVLDAIRKQKE